MSLLNTITKALPFQITRRQPERKGSIYDNGWGFLYPYLASSGAYGTDQAKKVRVTWNTYYQAMDNEWISACIDAYKIETLNTGFEVYSDNKEDDDPDVVDYITDLFNRPDGTDGIDTYIKFMSRGLDSYLGPGDWFFETVFDDTIRGLPIGLYFIQPHRLNYYYDTDQWGLIGTSIRYENDELGHIYLPDIANEIWGKSLIDKCAKSITMDINANNFNNDYFITKMDPRGVITFEKEMSEDDIRTSMEIMKKQTKDDPRGYMALKGASIQRLTQSNKDLEFTTLLNMMRDRIISTYGVPPQNVGVYAAGSLGNERDNTADKKFKKRLTGKVFKPVEDEFKRILGSSFELFGWDEEFHFGDIDLEDKMQRANIENIRLRNGSLLVNEVRTGYGEDVTAYGDEPLPYVMGAGGYSNQQVEPVKHVERDTLKIKSILQEKGYMPFLETF